MFLIFFHHSKVFSLLHHHVIIQVTSASVISDPMFRLRVEARIPYLALFFAYVPLMGDFLSYTKFAVYRILLSRSTP